ncbi:MAG: response regulator transcription factor [Deferrisomatales bacterium]
MGQHTQKVVLVEDHTILREGLRALLSSDPELEVVGECADGREAIACAQALRPDVMLLDLSMPRVSGLAALKAIKQSSPQTRVLVLTVHKTEEYVFEALQAGADGYVLKDSSANELRVALESIQKGLRYVSPSVSSPVIEGYLGGRPAAEPDSPFRTLTQREREVLKLVAEGYKNREIADLLCISAKTVEKHRSNLMRKLDLHSVSELTAYAIRKGLTTG